MADISQNPNTNLNRYIFMQDSAESDIDGNFYPDICTFNIENFKYTEKPYKEKITQTFAYRLDILINELYSSFNLYDELALWLNDKLSLSKEDIGTIIYMPDKRDLDTFYKENIVNK